MSRFDEGRVIRERIRQQSAAEFALSDALDASGVDYETFLQTYSLTTHEFNLLAHLLHGVNDTFPSTSVAAAAR